jgi:hypothetical protein
MSIANQFQTNRFIFIFTVVMLTAVAIYYAYTMIDGLFLAESETTAKVIKKQYVPPGVTYVVKTVGNQNLTMPMTTEGLYMVTVKADGLRGQIGGCGVSADYYQRLNEGDQVRVRFMKRRITGRLQITRILPEAG